MRKNVNINIILNIYLTISGFKTQGKEWQWTEDPWGFRSIPHIYLVC